MTPNRAPLASVSAVERSHLFRLGQSDFYSLISERPDVTQAINRVLWYGKPMPRSERLRFRPRELHTRSWVRTKAPVLLAILEVMKFGGLSVLKAPDTAGRSSVAVILSSDMKMTTTEGEIYPGAALQPKQAKLLAYRILAIAAEIEAEPI